MGFYLEMNRVSPSTREFAEGPIPPFFWVLYGLAGFALTCMGLAAHSLLGDLARLGSGWDQAIVWTIIACLPVYLLIGLKMVGLRKFTSYDGDTLRVGFRFFGKTVWERKADRDQILRIVLVNQKPSPNLAHKYTDDPAYQIRGHWRLIVETKDGKKFMIDKHTERGALEPLDFELQAWLLRELAAS